MATANDSVTEQGSGDSGARILVVDNYDSFVYTIVGYLKTLGAQVRVVRNDDDLLHDILNGASGETQHDAESASNVRRQSDNGDAGSTAKDPKSGASCGKGESASNASQQDSDNSEGSSSKAPESGIVSGQGHGASLDDYDGVLISPGPGTPADAGYSEDMIRLCAKAGKPMMGVCLGLQALAEVYGATVGHAPHIMHGKTSEMEHDADGLFEGVPNPLTATRYHSLAVDPRTLPAELVVTARSKDDGTIQAVRHARLPLVAVQFHPESVMSVAGYRIFANWLAMCGDQSAVARSQGLSPKVCAPTASA